MLKPAPDASPGRAQRGKVLDRFVVLKKAKEVMEATVQDARSKLKLAERLFAAKKRRWEAPKMLRTSAASGSSGSRPGCRVASTRPSLS